jgi:DUF3015 family protein
MMRKLAVCSFALAFVCAQAAGALAAANPDTGPGCGLGKLAWADSKNQKNIAPQVMMATTNGFGLYCFAISSGTSGCTNDGVIWASERANVFVASNFENLAQDIARGGGEHLASLAALMGVPAEQQTEFFAMTQERYLALLQPGDGSPVAMVKALHEAITHHPVLVKVATSR